MLEKADAYIAESVDELYQHFDCLLPTIKGIKRQLGMLDQYELCRDVGDLEARLIALAAATRTLRRKLLWHEGVY